MYLKQRWFFLSLIEGHLVAPTLGLWWQDPRDHLLRFRALRLHVPLLSTIKTKSSFRMAICWNILQLLTLEANDIVTEMFFLALAAPLPYLVASKFIVCFHKLLLLLDVVVVVNSLNLSLLTNLNSFGISLLHHSFDILYNLDSLLEGRHLLYWHNVLPW